MATLPSSPLGLATIASPPSPSSAKRAASVLRSIGAESDPVFYDTRILVGTSVFHAHRAVLAAQSSVFRTMFLSGMREARESEFVLGEVSPDAFRAALSHMYGHTLSEEPHGVLVDAFALAHRMDIPELGKVTTDLLLKGVTGDLHDLRDAWKAAQRTRTLFVPTYLCLAANGSGHQAGGSAQFGTTSASVHSTPVFGNIAGASAFGTSTSFGTGGLGHTPLRSTGVGAAPSFGSPTPAPPSVDQTHSGAYFSFGTSSLRSSGDQEGSGTTAADQAQNGAATSEASDSPVDVEISSSFASVQVSDDSRPDEMAERKGSAKREEPTKESPLTYLASLLSSVLSSDYFISFPFALLERILRSNTIVVPELQLFQAAMVWVSYHADREALLDDVLDLIRFPLMHASDLKIARSNPTAQLSSSFPSRLLDAFEISRPSFAFCRLLPPPSVSILIPSNLPGATKLFVFNEHVYELTVTAQGCDQTRGFRIAVAVEKERLPLNIFAVLYVRSASTGANTLVAPLIDGHMFGRRAVAASATPPPQLPSVGFGGAVGLSATARTGDGECTVWGDGEGWADVRPGAADALVCLSFVERIRAPGMFGAEGPLGWAKKDLEVVQTPGTRPFDGVAKAGSRGFSWNSIT